MSTAADRRQNARLDRLDLNGGSGEIGNVGFGDSRDELAHAAIVGVGRRMPSVRLLAARLPILGMMRRRIVCARELRAVVAGRRVLMQRVQCSRADREQAEQGSAPGKLGDDSQHATSPTKGQVSLLLCNTTLTDCLVGRAVGQVKF